MLGGVDRICTGRAGPRPYTSRSPLSNQRRGVRYDLKDDLELKHSLGIHLDDLGVQPDPRIQRSIHPSIHPWLIRYRPHPRYTSSTPVCRVSSFVQLVEDQVG